MDEDRFDRWTRGLDGQLTRRSLGLGGLVGGALVALGLAAETDAKKKKKKKKKKPVPTPTPQPQCAGRAAICTAASGCCSNTCCLVGGQPEGGEKTCRVAGDICCTAAEGGGSCPAGAVCCSAASGMDNCTAAAFPVCCPANAVQPQNYSCPASAVCCNTGTGCCQAPDRRGGRSASNEVGKLIDRL